MSAKSYLTSCCACAILLTAVSLPLMAADPDLKSDRPESYTVVKGDTLWDISTRFLKDPWRWKEIWAGNSQIANPDLIYPGDIIRLIFVDGKPQLVVNDNRPTSSPNTQSASKDLKFSGKKTLKTVKLSPKIHEIPLKKAIPNIPLEKINAFLSRNRVIDAGALENAPHIIASKDQRVIFSAGFDVYVRGRLPDDINNYGIYRSGEQYIDPITGEVLGLQAIDIGSANIKALQKDLATFAIVRSTTEVRVGDRLLPSVNQLLTSSFIPTPITSEKSGVIMAIERGISQAGRLDIVALNMGEREGVSQGSLLGIYKKGDVIRDRNAQPKTTKTITLPDERAGLVMVFKAFPKMSMGIILEAEQGVALGDTIAAP